MIHNAINLAQGYPDFPAPAFIKQAAIDAINADINQYAITWGSPRLRRAIADKTKRLYRLDLDPDREITVTCGATEAMMATMLAIVEPGDEVHVDNRDFLAYCYHYRHRYLHGCCRHRFGLHRNLRRRMRGGWHYYSCRKRL